MAESFQAIVDVEASLDDAAEQGERLRNWLVEQGVIAPDPDGDGRGLPAGPRAGDTAEPDPDAIDGLGAALIYTGRTVFWSEYGHYLCCPDCDEVFEPDDDEANEAVAAWESGGEAGRVCCPDCGREAPITDWDGAWGYGNLGVEFWHWPPLSERFVQRVADHLGHQVRVVAGTRSLPPV